MHGNLDGLMCMAILSLSLDFHIRVNRDVKGLIVAHGPSLDAVQAFKLKKLSVAKHISRFGLGNREEHTVKHIAIWRNAYWWHLQKKELEKGTSDFVHPRAGRIARWELQFPRKWMIEYSTDSK